MQDRRTQGQQQQQQQPHQLPRVALQWLPMVMPRQHQVQAAPVAVVMVVVAAVVAVEPVLLAAVLAAVAADLHWCPSP